MKIAQVILVTFLWASVLLISREVNLPSPVFVFYRSLFSLIVIVPLAIREKPEKPKFSLIFSGILLAFNWIFLFMGVSLVGPSTADFIYYTAPMISLAISHMVGEKIPMSSWIAAAISFTGVGMIFSFSPSNFPGMVYSFLGATFYGSVVVVGKIIKSSPNNITLYQMLTTAIITSPFIFYYGYSLDVKKVLLLIISGVLNTGLALTLWWDALKKLGVKTASVLSYLDPLFAFILSILILKYHPRISEILGGILILIGGSLASIESR